MSNVCRLPGIAGGSPNRLLVQVSHDNLVSGIVHFKQVRDTHSAAVDALVAVNSHQEYYPVDSSRHRGKVILTHPSGGKWNHHQVMFMKNIVGTNLVFVLDGRQDCL
jgi:hypothetical protein